MQTSTRTRWTARGWAALLSLLLVSASWAQEPEPDCSTEIICVTQAHTKRYVTIDVRNITPGPVTVRFTVEGENVTAGVSFPHLEVLRAGEEKQAFIIRPQNVMMEWSYRFAYQVMQGDYKARHNDNYAYALPYAPGEAFEVVQGYNGDFSHQGMYAIDWAMPEGTPVHAARGGRVIAVQDDMDGNGLDEHYKDKANYILILHDDGTTASYVHLQRGGALVGPGDVVFRGQVIGRSGNTGYSTDPHLHFEVGTIDKNIQSKTFPVRFDLGSGPPMKLQPRNRYTAPSE